MATRQQQKDAQAIADVQELVSNITVVSAVSNESVVDDKFNAHDVAIELQEITAKAHHTIARTIYTRLNGNDESKSAREVAREWLAIESSNAPKDNEESLTEWITTQVLAYRVFKVINENKATGERTTFEKCVKALNNGTNKNGITKAFAKSCKVGDEMPANLKLSESEIAEPQARKTKSLDEKITDDLDLLFKHLAQGNLDTLAYVNVQLKKRMMDTKALLESNAVALG